MRRHAPFETGLGLPAQFCCLVDRRCAFADREARQDRRLRARAKRAALRDLDRRRQRLRQIGEQRRHFGAGLEPMLGRELAAVGFRDHAPLGDADQRVVGLVVLRVREERLVGGDERNALAIGKSRPERARRRAARPCHGAAARCRAGRRTGAAASRNAPPPAPLCPAAIARSSGPPGPPVSAIRPSVAPSSHASLRWGFSLDGVSRKAREVSRIRLR